MSRSCGCSCAVTSSCAGESGSSGLAERLEAREPVNSCGVARARLLVRDGAGPLDNPTPDRLFADALWWIAEGLQLCPAARAWDRPALMKLDPEHAVWTCTRCGAAATTGEPAVRPAQRSDDRPAHENRRVTERRLSHGARGAAACRRQLVKGRHLIVGVRGARICGSCAKRAGRGARYEICMHRGPISTGSSRRQIYREDAKGGSSTGASVRDEKPPFSRGCQMPAMKGMIRLVLSRHTRRLDQRCPIRRSLQVRLRGAVVHGEEFTHLGTRRWCGSHGVRQLTLCAWHRAGERNRRVLTRSRRRVVAETQDPPMTRARAIFASDHGNRGPNGPVRLLARGARRSLARGPMTQQSRAQSMPRSRFE